LRNIGKPVFIAANKAETRKVEEEAAEFYQFGFELIPVSAEHGNGVGDLLDGVFEFSNLKKKLKKKNPTKSNWRSSVVRTSANLRYSIKFSAKNALSFRRLPERRATPLTRI
jgi:predicted GTPase